MQTLKIVIMISIMIVNVVMNTIICIILLIYFGISVLKVKPLESYNWKHDSVSSLLAWYRRLYILVVTQVRNRHRLQKQTKVLQIIVPFTDYLYDFHNFHPRLSKYFESIHSVTCQSGISLEGKTKAMRHTWLQID